jgi:hypothetical protein
MKGITMSKKNKTAKANIEVDVQPVPFGVISLDDFVSSKTCDAALQIASNYEDSEKAFLCSYQVTEICNAVRLAGLGELLLKDEEFQKQAIVHAKKMVSAHFIEMFMAVGGTISNLLAQNEDKGGV